MIQNKTAPKYPNYYLKKEALIALAGKDRIRAIVKAEMSHDDLVDKYVESMGQKEFHDLINKLAVS